MKLPAIVINVQIVFLFLAILSSSQAQERNSVEEQNDANNKLDKMALICQNRVKLHRLTNKRDDPHNHTIAGCARICGVLAKKMKTASLEQRSKLMDKVPQCEKLYNSLPEDYQQDVSALITAHEKQKEETYAVDITELGDVQGILRSIGPLASSSKTVVIETSHAHFNTLCKGRAVGISDSRGVTLDQSIILKGVKYRRYKNKPDVSGTCIFNGIALIK